MTNKQHNRNVTTETKMDTEIKTEPQTDSQPATTDIAQGTTIDMTEPTASPTVNNLLKYRRRHPGGGALGRCSYGIPGVPGIVVFDLGLFANNEPPESIQLLVNGEPLALTPAKADNKMARDEAAAKKLLERAQKAQERLEAQQAKAKERQEKANAAVANAKARADALTSKSA